MGNLLKIGDPNCKRYSEKTWRAQIPFLQHADTVASYIVIGYSTNSLTKSEFVIASYCGVEGHIASVHIVL